MVAVVTGAGVGLQRSSAQILGSMGLLGNSMLGRVSDNVYVNAASGNLVVQREDEFLIGRGPDSSISRTYNSIGNMPGELDNWTLNVQRKVDGKTGTVNTVGSTVTRTDWDGTQVTYYWAPSLNLYMSREGAGAFDSLTYDAGSSTWTWTDGSSQLKETYDENNEGRIASSTGTDGHSLSFTYSSGLISRVQTADGSYTDFVYFTNTNKLKQLTTVSGSVTTSRTSYEYDLQNRLSKVTVDKTPADGSIVDGNTNVTNYTYVSDTRLINQVWTDNGPYLFINYGMIGGQWRVSEVRQADDAIMRYTTFSYDLTAHVTTITEQDGSQTKLTYDDAGQLTKIAVDASLTAPERIQTFAYDGAGNVKSVTDGGGHTITYSYDNNDNRVGQFDSEGNQVNWTYNAKNQLVEEVRFSTPDPDQIPGAPGPGDQEITRYVYFNETQLRFVVSPEGRVTQYGYNVYGQVDSIIEYTESLYSGPMTYGDLAAWFPGPAGWANSTRTLMNYDFRGNLTKTTQYSAVLATGHGDTSSPAEVVETYYEYSQTGQLLSRQVGYGGPIEYFVYDGLGRMISSTDFLGRQTNIAFSDASGTTVVTLADNSSTTSVYNRAGELVSISSAGIGVAAATTTYKRDSVGRLRITTDPLGNRTYILYDTAGRKNADIDADGSLVEYVYDSDDRVIATIAYATKLSAEDLDELVDTSGNPTSKSLADVRPTAHADDRWDWKIYDSADRLSQTIDAAGAVKTFSYDGVSRLVATTAYANLLSASTLAGFKTTPPTTIQTPTTDAGKDRVVRNFYDRDGLLRGILDGEGYLTEMVYDAAGRKVETVGYYNKATQSLWATGYFHQLKSSVGTHAKDIHHWYLYDSRDMLRAEIDGEGTLTRYHYTALGDVDQVIFGQQLNVSSLLTTRPTLANLPAAGGSEILETTNYTRDAFGMVLTETKLLASGTNVTTHTYDNMRRLVSTTTASATSDARTATQRYDGKGRLIGSLTGEGSAALAALGSNPTQAQLDTLYKTWGATYAYDAADRLISKTEPNGLDASPNRTLYYYDSDGQLSFVINAVGEVTEYRYNAYGERSDVIVYATRILPGTLASLTGGAVVSGVTSAVAAIANSAADIVTGFRYDVRGQLKKSIDALSVESTFGYNAFGELSSQISPVGVGSATTQSTFAYDRVGGLFSTTANFGGLNLTSTTLRDAFGRAIEKVNPLSKSEYLGYDRVGRTTLHTDELGHSAYYYYDARGNLINETDRNGKMTDYAYTAFQPEDHHHHGGQRRYRHRLQQTRRSDARDQRAGHERTDDDIFHLR